jgi:hypothetical protein
MECILKKDFVEDNNIAFTSSDTSLCLRSPEFCDSLSCYDCACISEGQGMMGGEKICAASQYTADTSVPASTLSAIDDCVTECINTDGTILPSITEGEKKYVFIGDGLCAIPGTSEAAEPVPVQSCNYANVPSEIMCQNLCDEYTVSEEAYLFGTNCYGYSYLKESSFSECMLYGLESWCPTLQGYTSYLFNGSLAYNQMSVGLGGSGTSCMLQYDFALAEVLDSGPQIAGAFAALFIVVLVLAMLLYVKQRHAHKVQIEEENVGNFSNAQDSNRESLLL